VCVSADPPATVLPARLGVLSVHTSPLHQPGGGNAGGLNVYVVETARRLARRGIAVEIVTCVPDGWSRLTPFAPGVRVRHVPVPGLAATPDADVAALLEPVAARLAVEADYDVVHAHYWSSGLLGRRLCELAGVPMVFSGHTLAAVKNARRAADERAESVARLNAEQRIVATAERLVAATHAEAAELVGRYGADPAAVDVVPPGVDLSTFTAGDPAAARAVLEVAPDAALLAFVGRLQPHKGPDVVIRAAALLHGRIPELAVLIVGGRSGASYPRGALRRLAADLGLADVVRFLPPMPPAQLADVYRAADVLVMPSRSESFGLAAVEAQACGTPVVGTDVDGLASAVRDGRSGLLVARPEPSLVADAVRRLLTEPGLRPSLRAGALAHAAGFSWESTVDGLLASYRHARCGSAAA